MNVRRAGARLLLEVEEPADVVLQIAVDDRGLSLDEALVVSAGDRQLEVEPVRMQGLGRAHRFRAEGGRVEISYDCEVRGTAPELVVSAEDAVTYLRPSRYAESDRLVATAEAEFAGITDSHDLLNAVSSWVGTRLAYVAGASRPTDGAVETLLAREGVCRDYAHLVVALLRARDMPARLVSVYAPGLSPMDFHAVAEAAVDGAWCAVDATALAPRSALMRIATGRDAADAAFLSTYGGGVHLRECVVSASVDGDLPADDVTTLVSLG